MNFSIVTPSFNSGRFIRETIESVVSQEGDFIIEYIVVDNRSTDGTVDILREYERTLSTRPASRCRGVSFRWLSEGDDGMYDAINRGFALATGDVYAWINADDIYLPGAFAAVNATFRRYPHIRWLKGITSYIDESSAIREWGKCNLYDRGWIRDGIYGREAYFIQQDSVFWNADLWREAGGIDARLKKAGDYCLWIAFSRYAPLHSLNYCVSCFRMREGQMSRDLGWYLRECDLVKPREDSLARRMIACYFRHEGRVPARLRPFLYRLFFRRQDLNLVEWREGGTPVLRKATYCRV